MSHHQQFYINGQWVAPKGDQQLDVINPATEEAVASIALGTKVRTRSLPPASQRARVFAPS